MIVILCVDDNMGMTFLGKRLSKDRCLRERILSLTSGAVLYMNSYSAGQFEEGDSFVIGEDFLEKTGRGEYCFLENKDVAPFADRIEKFIIYKWNRTYPSDFKFTFPLEKEGFFEESSFDFEGFSHENITETVYVRHP